MKILKIFGGNAPNMLVFVTEHFIAQYNIKVGQITSQENL
jgi:hypothetical protein